MQHVSLRPLPFITPYRLEVSRQDQGTATMTFYYDGVAQFSATRAGWDDAIPWGSGTYFAEQSTRFGLPMWDFMLDPEGREAVQLHAAQKLPNPNTISAGSFGCLVADGNFLNAMAAFIAAHGNDALEIKVLNDFPVSLSCSTTTTQVDEGTRIVITVNLNANANGVSKDLYVKIGLAPGSTGTTKDFNILVDPIPGTSADDLRSLGKIQNQADTPNKSTFASGLYVKIPAGQTSGQIVVDILQDRLQEPSETLIFRVEDYAFNSPYPSGAERLYSDYKTSPKVLIDSSKVATVTIGDAVTLDEKSLSASGSSITFIRVVKVVPGHSYTYSFDAFNVPDALKIYDNSRTYIDTGSVSGAKTGTITIPTNSDGFLTVRVQGNPNPTDWTIFVGPANGVSQKIQAAVSETITAIPGVPEGQNVTTAVATTGQLAISDDRIFALPAGQAVQLTASIETGKFYSLVVIVPPDEQLSPEGLVTSSVPVEAFNLETTFTNSNLVGYIQADRTETITLNITDQVGSAGNVRVVFTEIAPTDLNAFAVGMANRLIQETNDPDADGIAFTIYRLGDLSQSSSVGWRIVPDGDNPLSAADFGGVLPSGTVTFAAGRVQQFVQVFPTADFTTELPEGFRIELYDPTGGRLADLGIHGQAATVSGFVLDVFDAPIVDAGTPFSDEIVGAVGGDMLSGSDGADTIYGRGGPDQIDGGQGNDIIVGGFGGDLLIGGSGFDRFVYSTPSESDADEGFDEIFDFETGKDILDASTLGPRNFALIQLSPGIQLLELTTETGSLFITIHGAIGPSDIRGIVDDGIEGTAIGGVFGDFMAGDLDADLIYGAAGGDRILGNGGNDTLFGNTENDYITGGLGDDRLNGGAGTDRAGYYQTDAAVGGVRLSLLLQGQPQDTGSQGMDTLLDFEQLSGTPFSDQLIGDDQANWLWGSAAYIDEGDVSSTNNDTLDGQGGDDLLMVGTGNHVLLGGPGIDTIAFTENGGPDPAIEVSLDQQGSAQITGAGSWYLFDIENLSGGRADDQLSGDGNANILAGGDGADKLFGNGGDDRLLGDGEMDIEFGRLGYTGPVTLFETDRGAGDDLLDGGVGADVMIGGAGNDTYVVDDAADLVAEAEANGTDTVRSSITFALGANLENLNLTGAGIIDGTGNSLANVITGNSAANLLKGAEGDDTLDGGAGVDKLFGGAGNDTFIVDNAGDAVTEDASAGVDTVRSSIAYTLGVNLENLTLTGAAAISGTGNTLSNTIIGNSAANVLSGGTGNDTLDGAGGADTLNGDIGNDVYVVDASGDRVIETSATGGIDTVMASLSYILGANVENLILIGTATINGTGNALANQLTGNSAANRLDGGAGADVMTGGAGNDTFIADSSTDRAIELSDTDGTDTVQASVSFILGAFVENLTLTGSAAINGTGNALANFIVGNAAANVLNGGAGADLLRGGAGDDRYTVDNAGDRVVETSDADGVDTVTSSVTFALSSFVENLTLTGSGSINGTGNTLANYLIGNAGANVLDGRAGADLMKGGAGNDTYVVDDAGDRIAEAAAADGTDLVKSSVSFTLGNFVENLTLTGTSVINGTGNGAAISIIGNAAANILDGRGGADFMRGGAGDDTYMVDDVADRAVELAAGDGLDSVNSSVSFTLAAFVENLTLTGSAAINATGNSAGNALTGNAAANLLNGMAGSDTLQGGGGADGFLFTTALDGTNVDRILDFQVGVDDILLKNSVFTGLATGALAAGAFNTGAAATEADDRIIYDPTTGALFFDADGNGAGAALQFATLQAGLAMSASDFIVN
jgi:Ca2+-binding RTX toxin-like protein